MSAIKNAIAEFVEFQTRDVMPLSVRWKLQDSLWDSVGNPESAAYTEFYAWLENRNPVYK